MRWLKLIGCSAFLWVGCEPRLPELDAIREQQKELRKLLNAQGPQSSTFLTAALNLVRAEEAFVAKYPNHPDVPNLLIEAAEIYATYFGDVPKAVQLLRIVDLRFRQKSAYAPRALFYEAFLYENMLSDTATARERYEAFLRYYPDHELAQEARLSLQNLGKSPEQLLREILQKKAPQ